MQINKLFFNKETNTDSYNDLKMFVNNVKA